MQEKIYDPDGLIASYSRYFGRDLLNQEANTEIRPTDQQNPSNGTKPTESESSQLSDILLALKGCSLRSQFLASLGTRLPNLSTLPLSTQSHDVHLGF